MGVIDIDFSDILLNEKSYDNIFIRTTLYKTFVGAKALCIWLKNR